jgi:hypothetical protein
VNLDSSAQASVTYTSLSPGVHSVKATYNATSNFVTSNTTASVTVAKAATSVSLSESPTSTVFGQTLTLTANVANNSTSATPTGTVQFSIDGGAQVLTATLSAGKATAKISTLAAGSHTIVANYLGTATFAASASNQDSYTVNPDATNINLATSPNPATPGQKVTFTATVTSQAPGAGIPAGQVTFFVDGAPVATVNVINGKATFSTSSLAVGSYTITASYSDTVDGNYLDSSSNSVTQKIAFNSTTTIKSSKNPSIHGQNVNFTATVTTGATGTVTFFVDGVNVGTFNLNGNQAVYSTSSLAVGRHTIKAVYSGDSAFNASTATMTQTVYRVVNRRV